ncbi:MAG: GNAT family N-acetyltransferase [Pseudomonadota bacterium]
MDIHIVSASWAERGDALRALRQLVLLEELQLPALLLEDPDDLDAEHLIALNSAGQLVGAARLIRGSGDWAELGRVAVTREQRGKRIGARLVRQALDAAARDELPELRVDALAAAQPFYERQGFRVRDHAFSVAGVRHVPMSHPLMIAFASPFDADQPRPAPAVIETAEQDDERQSSLREFDAEDAAKEELLRVLSGARRRLLIFSPQLEPALFDDPAFVERISALARGTATAEVQILIRDSSLIVANGHALIELAQRLDNKIRVRRTPEQMKVDEQSWAVADDTGLWVQSEPEALRGWADAYAPVHAQRLVTRFSRYWERSSPDPDLRLLKL